MSFDISASGRLGNAQTSFANLEGAKGSPDVVVQHTFAKGTAMVKCMHRTLEIPPDTEEHN